MLFKLSLYAISALAFVGCAIGKDYKRIETKMPDSFRGEKVSDDRNVMDNNQWWKEFKDENLNNVVEEVLKNNYDLQSANASIDGMLGKFDEIESYLYPQIGAGVSMSKNYVDGQDFIINQRSGVASVYAGSLSLVSYELDLFGKVRRANESARAVLLATEYAKSSLKISLIATTVASYIRLSSIREQIEMREKSLVLFENILKNEKMRYEAGVIQEQEYNSAVMEVNSAKTALVKIKIDEITEMSTLNVLMGKNPSEIKISKLSTIETPRVPSGIPSDLLIRRPDIALAEQNLISANAQIGVARAAYYPSIKLTGSAGVQSLDLAKIVSSPTTIMQIMPSISVPIFTAGRIDGEIRTAEAEERRLLAQYKKSIIVAFGEVDVAIGQVSVMSNELNNQKLAVSALNVIIEKERAKQGVGVITTADLEKTEQKLLLKNQELLISKEGLALSLVGLYKSLGGDLEKSTF